MTEKGSVEAQSLLDLLMPALHGEMFGLTDPEARALYGMWQESPPGASTFKMPRSADSRMATTLKSKGYIHGYGERLELTEKGRKIIVEMATNEPNALDKKDITYSSIKAKKSASRRPRQAFFRKASPNDPKRPFNLREHSSRKITDAGDDIA